jgi:hypothetical protein
MATYSDTWTTSTWPTVTNNPQWIVASTPSTIGDTWITTTTTSDTITGYIVDSISKEDKAELKKLLEYVDLCLFIVNIQERLLEQEHDEELEARIKENVLQLRDATDKLVTAARKILETESQEEEATAIAEKQARKDKKRLGYELGI